MASSVSTFTLLTEEERETNENYITLMKENLELIKEEVYKN